MTTNLKLKNPVFEALRVTGEPDQFSELKAFCGGQVKITYETAPGIGDFWCITLYDALKDKTVTVPDGNYILKIADGDFTVVESYTASSLFDLYDNCPDPAVPSKEER